MLTSFCSSFQLNLCWAVCRVWQADGETEYTVYYFSSASGLPIYKSVCLSIRLSAFIECTHTWIIQAKRNQYADDEKRTTLMSNVPKSHLHYKFQAYDCHKTALTVKVTILYNFPACEISLTLEISTVWKQQNSCNFRLDICVPLENMAAMFCGISSVKTECYSRFSFLSLSSHGNFTQ